MSVEDRDRFLEMALSPSPNDLRLYVHVLKARLRVFEERYELSSRDLPIALQQGSIRETREVSQWIFLAELQVLLEQQARPESSR